jgi:hypothetical protein
VSSLSLASRGILDRGSFPAIAIASEGHIQGVATPPAPSAAPVVQMSKVFNVGRMLGR